MNFTDLMHYLSWNLYSEIFYALAGYGFYLLPLLILLYSNYLQKLEVDMNTSISAISINNMFNSTIIYMIVFLFAVIPFIDSNTVKSAKADIYKPPTPTTELKKSKLNSMAEQTLNTVNPSGLSIKIPAMFAVYDVAQYTIVSGAKQAVASLNIDDIRKNIVITMQNSAIKSSAVKRTYNKFINRCYNPARKKFDSMTDVGYIVPSDDENEYNWAGGSYYLNHKTGIGLYWQCTEQCVKDRGKDYELFKLSRGAYLLPQKGGVVFCGEEWENKLRPILKKEFQLSSIKGTTSNPELTDTIIREYLAAERVISIDPDEGSGFGILAALKSVVSWVVGLVGTAVTTLLKIITTYLITVILPMVQALLLFVIVVTLPIILAFSGFRLDYLFSIFMSMFAVSFVTVIIAVISIVDNSLLALLTSNAPQGSGGFMQAVHIAGSGGGLEFFLINLLILFFYIIAIKMWFGFMASFGGNVMKEISKSMTTVGDMDIASSGNTRMSKFSK